MSRKPIVVACLVLLLPLLLTVRAAPLPTTPWAATPAPPPGSTGVESAQRGGGAVSAPPAVAVESADGRRSVWVSEDGRSVWSATRAAPGAEWGAADRLLTIRGTVRNLMFSPDGGRIAFENPRTTANPSSPDDEWGFIVIYELSTQRISYVDPAFATDTEPSWSPDGNRISFVRTVEGLPDERVTRPTPASEPAAWTPPPTRPQERYSVASVLAAPLVYPPQPSAAGRSIAWVAREATERSIYFMRLGEPARRIVSFGGDDGQELSDLAVSVGGAAVAFVRGGSPNRQGDVPNPAALPNPPQQLVWIVGTRDDLPRLLGHGSDPLFAPDDGRVLWMSEEGVMSATLSWNDGRLHGVGAPRQFASDRLPGLRFSPDGTRIAYERGGGIEVYELSSGATSVIPHDGARDQDPVWSPDSRRIAFRRQDNAGADGRGGRGSGNYRYSGPVVSDRPWSIWQVDVAELDPQRVWQAEAGVVGSVYYSLDQGLVAAADQLFWSADDRIAFVWEGDGWRHLYAVPASGGPATLLTPGDGEVESAALSADRTELIYATNIGDLGRRHISAVGFDGSPPRSITGGTTSQWSPTPLADGKLAYIEGGWSDPPAVMVRDANGATEPTGLPRVPASFPAAELVEPQLVEFPASDGQIAYGQLFVPASPQGCAIIFAHGGIRRQMLPGFHYMDAYSNLYELNQYLTSRGCVVLSVEYRSSIMRGEAFRNAPGWGFASNSELLDFVGAAHWLMAREDVDESRGVGIYGLSWGGYMAANALAKHSDIFTVGFDMAGVHNSSNDAGVPYSAVGNVDTWTSPVLLAQGDDDRNVSFSEGMSLARALLVKRPEVELVQRVFPDETHDLYLKFENLVTIYDEGAAFLLRHLGIQ